MAKARRSLPLLAAALEEAAEGVKEEAEADECAGLASTVSRLKVARVTTASFPIEYMSREERDDGSVTG